MNIYTYLSFLVLVITIVYSPGPMTLFLMSNGMQRKFKEAWPILLGANHAYLISIIIFAAGLSGLLQKNIWILKLVQIIGIIYLLYLSYVQWKKAPFNNSQQVSLEVNKNNNSLYLKGAFIALSNPKAILLFSVVFPEFISGAGNRLLQIIILGMTFLILQFSSGCVYLFFGHRMNNAIEKPKYQIMINKVSSLVLVIVAGFLLYKL